MGGSARLLVGDVFDRLAGLPDGSVDLVLTSPPFLALRSYLPADHPDKTREIGGERDPAAFIDTLLALTAEFGRVLAPHGSLAVELGDTYAGSGGAGGDYDMNGRRDGQHKFSGSGRRGGEWPLGKSLCGIPELYAFSLAYGRNLLTGADSPAGRWRVRNTVAWCRPNPSVGALSDKFRPAKSLITIACRDRTRWFDLDAVRKINDDGTLGAPPLDWWQVATVPYKGSHYAVWPPGLLKLPIEAMCPREVCRTCGEPRRRVSEKSAEYAQWREATGDFNVDRTRGSGLNGITNMPTNTMRAAAYVTAGWSDCGHGNYRPGVVLDPFAGSGTTLMVATQRGRDAIGIDLDERNIPLAQERLNGRLSVDARMQK